MAETVSLDTWFNIGMGVAGIIAGFLASMGWFKSRTKAEEKKEIEEASITKSDYQTRHTNIHDLLTTLRVESGASRAKIGHFHNGGKFLDGSPMKKFSVTHESCMRGAPYDGQQLQNIHVTIFWDMVERMRENDGVLHQTEQTRDGFFRSYNKSNDIIAYSVLPITKQDLYIGFILLEWTNDQIPPYTDPSFIAQFKQSRDYIELELALR
jgi:hypothetical protein